jgi:hypothetical protein
MSKSNEKEGNEDDVPMENQSAAEPGCYDLELNSADDQHLQAAEVMEIDAKPADLDRTPIYKKPNYGTTQFSKTVEPSLPSPNTIPLLFEEFKQFSLLKK